MFRRTNTSPAIISTKVRSGICALAGLLSIMSSASYCTASQLKVVPDEVSRIGQKIWLNECSGSISGLTSWNAGEEFASLGIGHFIWYPAGYKGPFEESFPPMIRFLSEHGAKLPEWLSPDMPCPWKSRTDFLQDKDAPHMVQLRNLLKDTVDLQTQFIIQRFQTAEPAIIESAPAAQKARVEKNFSRVWKTGSKGVFALIDYVNFKGKGISETERYNGQGWGLLQVLEEMPDQGQPLQEFIKAASKLLTQRVANSPPQRNEKKWLPGWLKRVRNYDR